MRKTKSRAGLPVSEQQSEFGSSKSGQRALRSSANFLARLPLLAHIVADIGAAHPEDHIFGNVGSMIGDPLQIAGDEQCVQRLTGYLGPIIHRLDEHDKSFIAHSVDDV